MLHIVKTRMDTGKLEELTLDTLEKGTWLQLTNPTAAELAAVSKAVNVDIDNLRSALDDEERSRTEIEDNYMMVITNVPVMRSQFAYDTLPLGIILTTDYIITITLEAVEVINEFNQRNSHLFCTFKRTRFMFQLLYKSATLYLRNLRQISRLTDELELQLRKSMENEHLFRLLELQKALTYFTVSLRSNGTMLDKLLRMRTNSNLQHIIKVFEEDEDLLEDVIIENKQAREMVEMYTHIVRSMLETFSSIISNNLNRVMRFLTSITIILAIPTMIASFFGVNVPVPMAEEGYGFATVVLVSLTAMASIAFLLRQKGMV